MYSVLDLFCGTGALSFGLSVGDEQFKTIGGVDLDHDAIQTAKLNHPGALFIEDAIENVNPDTFSEGARAPIDVIVGGPPCQGFSSLRPTRGAALEDPRNKLYSHFARFVTKLQPKVFLMENVVGITSSTRGNLVEQIQESFSNAGYATEWRILNAANFGVPQKRERFIMIGVRNDIVADPATIFPTPTHIAHGRTIGIRDRTRMVPNPSIGLPAVTTTEAISDLPELQPGAESQRYAHPPLNSYQAKMREGSKTLHLHQATAHNQKMIEIMRHAGASKSSIPEGLVKSGYSSSYSRLDPNAPATTITVKFTSPASSKCIHPYQNRAITPREAARLQSFPDRFQFYGGRTSVASQIGNAVPPLLSASFAPQIAHVIESYRRTANDKVS